MPYQYDLGPGQRIFLDNPGSITRITLASGSPGQQQQSSTQIQTGVWTEVPQVAQGTGGLLLRCVTDQGAFVWQVQGMQIGAADDSLWSAPQATPMQPVEAAPMAPMLPMAPMAPMKMGDMEMSANPMTMRMGNMKLSMEQEALRPSSSPAKFCTQCGTAVGAGDRFCGSCGHQLQ